MAGPASPSSLQQRPGPRSAGSGIVSDFTTAIRGLLSGNISNYRYQALPGESERPQPPTRPPPYRLRSADAASGRDEEGAHAPDLMGRRRGLKVVLIAMLLVLLAFLALIFSGWSKGTSHRRKTCDTVSHGYRCRPSISRLWGQYSSYFSVLAAPKYSASIPVNCSVTFVQLLSRHGARDPTRTRTDAYNETIRRIQARVQQYSKGYAFIGSYDYALGANQLTLFGERQMVNSGIKFYERYGNFSALSWSDAFVRASGSGRVVVSAQNWTQGLHQARTRHKEEKHAPTDLPWDVLVIPEEVGANNTLSHQNCDAFENGPYAEVGDAAQREWAVVFTPRITARLNKHMPGANLTLEDTINMMDMCPFTTVAAPLGRPTKFCDLFTVADWEAYDYYQTLGKWYGYGNGNPLGPSQGVGFVNELVARLTRTPVRDDTTTNSTLDADPETFPLDRSVYADFSHDNDMTAIFGALGLFDGIKDLPRTRRVPANETGGYSAAWTVPFAARMYVEKMTCSSPHRGGEEENQREELVRIILNDRVVVLPTCDADKFGRCTLASFVDGLDFAKRGGDWGLCRGDEPP